MRFTAVRLVVALVILGITAVLATLHKIILKITHKKNEETDFQYPQHA